jgi:hypothetical protein
MEPEGSSPCSQEPFTGSHPEPNRSSPYHPILSKIYFNIIHLRLAFLVEQAHVLTAIGNVMKLPHWQ